MTKAIMPQPKRPGDPPQNPVGGYLVKWTKYMTNLARNVAHYTGVARGFQGSFGMCQ